MIKFLEKIENSYDVNSIIVNGVPIWGLLRTSFYIAYGNKYKNIVWAFQKRQRISWFEVSIALLHTVPCLFKRHKYFFLSESNERRLVNTKQFDKICDGLIDILGKKHCVLAELPVNGNVFKKAEVHTRNIITSLFFYYLAKLLPTPKHEIRGENILQSIVDNYKLDIDYRKTIILFLKYRKMAVFFLRLWKPNAVFIKCYYSPMHQGFISAANYLNIQTIELQHGLISEGHPSYKIFTKLDDNVFPQWILTNGILEKNILMDSKNRLHSRVIPVGNYYLEEIKRKQSIPLELIQLRKKFDRVVAVTLQDTVEEITISFIKQAASLNRNILFLIIPRNYSGEIYKIIQENILVDESLGFYQSISYVDFHVTVYSTCAIESVYFGTPNILLDFDRKSSEYFTGILEEGRFNIYVSNIDQFSDVVSSSVIPSKNEVTEAHRNIFKPNYKKNISKLMDVLLDSN